MRGAGFWAQKNACKCRRMVMRGLDDALSLARTQTPCTNVHCFGASIQQDARTLEVGRPGTACLTMGVTDLVTSFASFPTNCTNPSHLIHLLNRFPKHTHAFYHSAEHFARTFCSLKSSNFTAPYSAGSASPPGLRLRARKYMFRLQRLLPLYSLRRLSALRPKLRAKSSSALKAKTPIPGLSL